MLRLEKKPIRAAFVAGAVLAALTTTAAAQNLQLNVSPFSGAVTVQNTSGSPVSLDGYQITSAAGKLVPDPTRPIPRVLAGTASPIPAHRDGPNSRPQRPA